MSPGRELDAIIAEKVFGHTVVKNNKGGWSLGEADYYDSAGELILANPLPAYSTDIEAAWEVVEKINLLEHFDLHKDIASGKWLIGYGSAGGFDEQFPAGSTAPHAICLAALKAVEK